LSILPTSHQTLAFRRASGKTSFSTNFQPQNTLSPDQLYHTKHHNLTTKNHHLHTQKPNKQAPSTITKKTAVIWLKPAMNHLDNDTIVAISTPPGRGGIGIIRLSGPEARAIAEPLLKLRHPLAPAQARFAQIIDNTGEVLDEAIATWFAAPNSYTSEDVVEIAAHGSPILLDHLLRQCIASGARLAEPGEFTQRAFISGRLDLTQAEAVQDLIESTTLHQARIAAQQLGGSLSRQIAPIKQQLIALIAALEAGIDFAEDDIDLLPTHQITTQIQAIQAPLKTLEQTFTYGRIVREGFTLTIVGRPNAGKSSLFNRLVQRDRAIVTATAGTTRDLVKERISLEGIPVELIDTAGLREINDLDEAESIGIAKSREAMAEADIVLLVLDATAPLHTEDESLINRIDRPLLIAINKCDLSPKSPLIHRAIHTSALTGHGIPELRAAILHLVAATAPATETALLTNLRQQHTVSAALKGLAHANQAITTDTPHEMVLLDLYESLSALDALTGTTTSDDILHLIFSTFCIGK
jgi:tRNA modification GTPase